MKLLSESYQAKHQSPAIIEQRQRMERCSNLFSGIGAEYQRFMDDIHIDAMTQILAIEKAIAERYHYEMRKIIPDYFKQALRHKATLTYLQIAEDLEYRLIMTSGIEDDDN